MVCKYTYLKKRLLRALAMNHTVPLWYTSEYTKKESGKCFWNKLYLLICIELGFPGGSMVKTQPANAEDTGAIPGLRISSGKGNDNPLPCSHLKNPIDRGAGWAPWDHKEFNKTEWLTTHAAQAYAVKTCISLNITDKFNSISFLRRNILIVSY